MKNIYLLLSVIFALSANAQENKAFENMVEGEMKSASRTLNLVVNPNTLNYDITYHRLDLTVDPTQDPTAASISGKITTNYIAVANMNTLTFDMFDTLIATSVKINGVAATFNQLGTNELVIDLPSTQAIGTTAVAEVVYSGNPTSSGFGSFTISDHNGTPVLWTLSEPFGARDWWPCKQDLNDKIDSIDVYITAPSQFVSVSNGLEPEAPVVVGALKTTHFHHSYPIPAYLIAIAVTDYQVFSQQGGLGTPASPYFPITNYMYPETAADQIVSLAPTPSIINYYESRFGAYPFRNEKYGHCQFGWGGGMEHTTVSFMTASASGAYSRSLIAHEMGHQWFGDKITCGTWKDIWLNEGITEYLSGLIVEHLDGNTAFRTWKTGKITSVTGIPAAPSTSNLYLTDLQATSVNRIFSSTVTYNKGSMVTNMLRYKLGDTMFWQAMNTYINNPLFTYKYAVTTDFKTQIETVSGVDLTEFFNDWVYGQGYPKYTITVQNLVGNQAKINVNQTQINSNVSYFEMPLEIKITGAGGVTQILRVDNTLNNQEFIVPTNFLATAVVFDPEKNIITKNATVTLNPVLGTLANNDFVLEKAISLSPNPANDILNISTPNNVMFENAIIFNLLGQKVLESNSNVINVENLSNGIYSISIKTSEGNISKKFIKN
jgi:aminopeptidase N